MSRVTTAQDMGGHGLAAKSAVMKYRAARRAHLIMMPYVNRPGCFCTQPSRSAPMEFFIHRLQRVNQGHYSHVRGFVLPHSTPVAAS